MRNGGQLVFDGTSLRAVLFGGDSRNLLVTFDHRQVGKTSFGEATAPQKAVRQGIAVLRIQTASNDWFINRETSAMEAAISQVRSRFDRATAIGFSMGGYGMFRFARALSLESGIAISPQFTVSPRVMPEDTRFHAEAPDYDDACGDLMSVAAWRFNPLIIVDPLHLVDLEHALLLQDAFPRSRLLRLGFGGHPATLAITRGGRTGVLIDAALGQSMPEPIRKAFREMRAQNPVFLRRLATHAGEHHPKVALWANQRLATVQAT